MLLRMNLRTKLLIFITFISQTSTADVMLIILAEKNNVQNPFVTAVMQGISLVQTNNNGLTFDQISMSFIKVIK